MTKTAIISKFDMADYYGTAKAAHIKGGQRKGGKHTELPDTVQATVGKQHGLFDQKSSMKQLVNNIEQEIERLNESSLSGRERRAYQLNKLVSLGALPQKTPKTPFRILKGLRQKQTKREQKQRALERESGVLTRHASLARPNTKARS